MSRARIRVVTDEGKPVVESHLVRLGGWTEERFFAEAPETGIWEFADGEVVVHSPASPRHQRVVGFVSFLLRGFAERRGLGEVFTAPAVLRLRPGLYVEPDVFFVAAGREEAVGARWVEAPADLVVEVLSSSTRTYDLYEKARIYGEARVREYWAVDLERGEVTVHLLGPAGYDTRVVRAGRVESRAVPGFWVLAEWLWEDPPPPATRCLGELLADSTSG